jgi:hypothetical protein
VTANPTGAASTGGTSTAAPESGAGPQAHGQSSETGNGSGGIAQKIREQANARLSSGKDRALDGVGGVTDALRQTSQSLRDSQHDTIAKYIDQAVGQVDRVTQTLRQKDIGELMLAAQRLARRRPAVFVGSAFVIGVVAARFFKSSPPDHYDETRYGGDYRTRGMTSAPGSYPATQPRESEFRELGRE